MNDLPSNVYRVAQRRFDAIPGSPWVYWVSDGVRSLFEQLSPLADLDPPREGINTGDNERFVRFWWEIGQWPSADRRHVPFVKGAPTRAYFDRLDEVLRNDPDQIRLLPGAALRNQSFAFQEAVAFLSNATGEFRARLIPPGSMFCSTGGRASFPTNLAPAGLLGVLNSSLSRYILGLVNPTVTFTVGDIGKIPIANLEASASALLAGTAVWLSSAAVRCDEAARDFIAPSRWDTGIADQVAAAARLAALEAQIDDEVYRLYGISDADRAAIEAELAGGSSLDREDGEDAGKAGADEAAEREESEEAAAAGAMTREELAVRWISYAVGVVLGRFKPGLRGALGSAIYHRDDFAIGSLPAPGEAEFDELVGPAERFAYVDAEGGRHLFSRTVEQALADLALPDGIAVLDEGHPRDLPALVTRALALMLARPGDTEAESAICNLQSVIGGAASDGDLRAFLSKDFFTRWHLRWYRKRPVYWPLQSAKRSYGFVLFHERVDRLTLYTLQRDYLDYKLNAVRQQVTDLNQAAALQTGASRRATERDAAKVAALLDELTEFARTMERIVRNGYEPEQNWIDDGVILRLAPLWELLPLWKAEPKKYCERLARGDFDWSHIAMKYWPARVREKCRTNKSFAIAHGHEEWYGG